MFCIDLQHFVIFGGHTDRQTDRPTDQQTDLGIKAPSRSFKKFSKTKFGPKICVSHEKY